MSKSQHKGDHPGHTGSPEHAVPGKFSMKKEDLILIASSCQERNFAEEIDVVEKLGGKLCIFLLIVGEDIFREGLAVDYDKGISPDDIAARIAQYGSNRRKEIPSKCKVI